MLPLSFGTTLSQFVEYEKQWNCTKSLIIFLKRIFLYDTYKYYTEKLKSIVRDQKHAEKKKIGGFAKPQRQHTSIVPLA